MRNYFVKTLVIETTNYYTNNSFQKIKHSTKYISIQYTTLTNCILQHSIYIMKYQLSETQCQYQDNILIRTSFLLAHVI